MLSLSDNSPKNNTVSHFSFTGGNLTNHAGLILFKELFHQLHLKELISKVLVTNDKRLHYQYSDADIVLQFLYHLLAGYDTDSACQELKFDAYFPKLLESGQVASQSTLSRFLSRSTEATVDSLRRINLELVKLFLHYQGHQNLIIDVDSTSFTTYGKQEGTNYNAHCRETGYHPLYAFEGQLGYCVQASLRPGNVYCSEQAEDFNGLLREFLPKGKSINPLTDEELAQYLSAINERPRRLHHYKTSKFLFGLVQTA